MANLYATKSLGETWSPSHPRQGRFGSQQYSNPSQRSNLSWSRVWRGKASERFAIAALLVLGGFYLLLGPRQWHHPGSQAGVESGTSTLRHTAGRDELGNERDARFRAHGGAAHRHGHSVGAEEVDWSQYAYTTYATSPTHLCNALMLLSSLHDAGTQADRVILYPRQWQILEEGAANSEHTVENSTMTAKTETDWTSSLLLKARDELGVTILPIELLSAPAIKTQPTTGAEAAGKPSIDHTWEAGFTKFLSLNLTQYSLTLALDTDALLLQHMDDLFTLPSEGTGWSVAMVRAYWLEGTESAMKLSGGLLLAEPSNAAFERARGALERKEDKDWDMEVLNTLYGKSAVVLPHRPYLLLSGEFRSQKHEAYLGSSDEVWDADRVLHEARYVHFSDWPLDKPWELEAGWAHVTGGDQEAALNAVKGVQGRDIRFMQPKCRLGRDGKLGCREKEIWMKLYERFWELRADVCGLEFLRWERDQKMGGLGRVTVQTPFGRPPAANAEQAEASSGDTN